VTSRDKTKFITTLLGMNKVKTEVKNLSFRGGGLFILIFWLLSFVFGIRRLVLKFTKTSLTTLFSHRFRCPAWLWNRCVKHYNSLLIDGETYDTYMFLYCISKIQPWISDKFALIWNNLVLWKPYSCQHHSICVCAA
jgi:hypothetical protein